MPLDVRIEMALGGGAFDFAAFSDAAFDTASWTDVGDDVDAYTGVIVDYGIKGATALDRVAAIGTMRFALRNCPSANNPARPLGFYSPNNTNCRSGFGFNVLTRLVLSFGGSTIYKFVGRLDVIKPSAGLYHDRLVQCVVVDFMDETARNKLSNIPTQINQRSDQVFSALLANMAAQPVATSIATGRDTYPFTLDNVQDETTFFMQAFQDLAASEFGLIYVKGDNATGGVFTFESRTTRATKTTVDLALSNNMVDMQASRSRGDIINDVQVQVHGRRVDAAATTVLFTLVASTQPIAPMQTLTLQGMYRDPTSRANRVGGTDMQPLVGGVDYMMNTKSDGTGTDLTAFFTVTPTFGGNAAQFDVMNGHPTLSGFVTLLQCVGRGLYDYEVTLCESIDSGSQTSYGPNTVKLDMPMQSDAGVGQGIADYIRHLYSSPLTFVDSLDIYGNINDTLMAALVALDISSRITITETVTGLNAAPYFINAVHLEIKNNNLARASYILAPADPSVYWLLGVAGYSELGSTTKLAYA